MKIGEFVYANTHAELLNELLGTNYKAFMKCAIKLPDGKLLWMIELGNFVSKSGWINRLTSTVRITEKQVTKEFTGHMTYKIALLENEHFDSRDRVVFDIEKGWSSRKYIFRGVFRLNKEESTEEENVWDLVADEYTL